MDAVTFSVVDFIVLWRISQIAQAQRATAAAHVGSSHSLRLDCCSESDPQQRRSLCIQLCVLLILVILTIRIAQFCQERELAVLDMAFDTWWSTPASTEGVGR